MIGPSRQYDDRQELKSPHDRQVRKEPGRESSRSARASDMIALKLWSRTCFNDLSCFMRSVHSISVVFACFTALFLVCYAPALFLDRQFGFRDAVEYYYPLYQRVQ